MADECHHSRGRRTDGPYGLDVHCTGLFRWVPKDAGDTGEKVTMKRGNTSTKSQLGFRDPPMSSMSLDASRRSA